MTDRSKLLKLQSTGGSSARSKLALPIDAYLDRVTETVVRQNRDLVLISSTGSGKTTRVPSSVAKALNSRGRVYVLEPRRLAARLSAERVAEEEGWSIGREVGYQFRFEKKRSSETPLTFLTEGTFTRELLSNPNLEGVSAVVLDEFHERHLQGDLALALLRRLQKTTRPDLRVVVMSATLEKESLLRFLPQADLLEVEAPRFPIEVEYRLPVKALPESVRDAVRDALSRSDARNFGDVLVFLPGMAEIRRCEALLSGESNLDVIPLHGELTREEQARAFERSGRTKVILSTNIAESSLTIPGVNTVIDSGLARVASFSYWTGLPSLTTKSISRASAIQRMGRAGRTGPGRVIRLYAKGDFEGRAYQDVAEVQRVDLMGPVLELTRLLGTSFQSGDFEFFEAPLDQKLQAARDGLIRIGALDASGRITQTGESLVELPLHPRLGRVLREAAKRGFPEAGATIGAALGEGADLGLDAAAGLRSAHHGGSGTSGFDPLKRMRERLRSLVQGEGGNRGGNSGGFPSDEVLAEILLTGFPDRIARRRGNELVLSQGGSAPLPRGADQNPIFESAEFFLVLDVRELKGQGDLTSRLEVRSATAVDEIQLYGLEPSQIDERVEWEWNHSRKRWVCSEILNFQKLELSRKILESSSPAEGDRARLFQKLYDEWLARENSDSKVREKIVRDFIRLELAAAASGQPLDGKSEMRRRIAEAFPEALGVSDLPTWDEVWEIFPREEVLRLEKEVPTSVPLAGRKSAPVRYEPGQTPYVESRIQDFFGMKTGPLYLQGKKLALHLLAPNGRAVQITDDLSGFWKNHYPTLRKELMRRYPRHRWPEDPMAAYSDGKV